MILLIGEETIDQDRITLTLQIEAMASGRYNDRDSESVIDKVLDEIRHDNSISVVQIACKIGVSERTIGRYIKQLTEAGIIMREGTKTENGLADRLQEFNNCRAGLE